ncbi:MAG: sigma-54-dependent Fis family transcriptional regulator [Vicinamibacteria bacterium]|nr:sigma-54-dependent Fis family transcriptional regulator [Vicinamibacteria bacterium]
MARVLVVDDEEGIRSFLAESLETVGHEVSQAEDGEDALRRLSQNSFHLMITDLRMPGLDGMSLLRRVRSERPEMEIIVLTAFGTVEGAVEAMKLGAMDYLQKPISGPDEVRLLAARAVERYSLHALEERAAIAGESEPPLTYGAPAMAPIVQAIEKVARTEATVLLLGESGSGKEVAAQTIRRLSARAGGPFVPVNCAALSESLIESEIFGHEKGAFTGASARRRGRLELADGGTLFLDEVAELKPEIQAKLLRVLQDRRFERLGGSQTIVADVRLVAATNRDVESLVENGRFRVDLYHRLAVFPIEIPPLRERREDIPPLAECLLARIGRELGRSGLRLDERAAKLIADASWPGNIRELRNALERAAILAEDRVLRIEHFKTYTTRGEGAHRRAVGSLKDLEREAIRQALAATNGNRQEAARRLGISRRTLYDKMSRYGLD